MEEKFVEIILNDIVRRIELIESKLSKVSIQNQGFPTKKPEYKPGIATTGQIKYIQGLKGEFWEGMTKAEAGIEIDRLVKKKPKDKIEDKLIVDNKHTEVICKITEESKPLTKKEIKEIGEEALL